ncbi:DUF1697 domain-containing protein [bacterium]|nr:DUF1697 domain-containing protein [bacterium]
MASIVFLRGVNVGGKKSFRPSQLTKELSHLEMTSIGAAGTYVVRSRLAAAKLRSEISEALPVEAEVIVCSAEGLSKLAAADRFGRLPDEWIKAATILAAKPKKSPELPIDVPAGEDWQVRLVDQIGPFVLSLRRRIGKRLIYPNEVVEKHFGVPATTRTWNTIEKITAVLK